MVIATFCKVELDDSILCLNLRNFCINQAPLNDRNSGPEATDEDPLDEFAELETDLIGAIEGDDENELLELLEEALLLLDEGALVPIIDEMTFL